MEKLFASKNIRIQSLVDLYEDEINVAYSNKLLQLNVLIKFSGVSTNDDPYIAEETTVSANSYINGVIHSFVLFVSNDVLGPLPIFRIVADAVEFIERCTVETVIEDLKQIATSYSAVDENFDNQQYYKNAVWTYTTAVELIKKSRENLN